MWTTIVTAIIMPAAFFFASRWGTNGIAVAWLVVYPPIILPMFYKCFQRIEMTAREYVSIIMPALVSSAIMAAAMLMARLTVPQRWSLPLRFSSLVTLGVLVYIGALFVLYREHLGRIVRAVRSINAGAK
jgi:PST family polysaccharide transporter